MRLINEELISTPEVEELWNKIIQDNLLHDLGQEYLWISLWWKYFKDCIVQKKILLFIHDSEEASSIWPLMNRKKNFFHGLHVVGQIDGMITDYAIPICSSDNVFITELKKVLAGLKNNKIRWSYLKLNLPDWAGYYEEVQKKQINSAASHDFLFITKVFDHYASIYLKNSFEKYLETLGKRTRADIRKYLQIFENNNFQFKIVEGEGLTKVNDSLITKNKQNWTIFKNEQDDNTVFMQELVRSHKRITNGNIIMPALYYNNEIVASVFGYISSNRCFLHTAGVERTKILNLSPGITLYALLIKELITRKIQVLDLSPGIEDYKIRLNAKVETIYQVIIFPNNLQKFRYTSGHYLKRIINIFAK